ncbi:MAG: PKD domain-containing protein [Chitinophagales bacterium]|nr:PKD domain-containing protein [Chitinophagales bacterium]
MRHTNLHSVLQKLWVLCCTLVLVFAQTNASAQVFQNTLMLQSTDEYCAGLSGYDTPTNNATRFYMSVGNTTTGSPASSTLNRILLTKYDVNGNILWTKTIHVPGANSSWYATDIQAGFNTTTTEISSTTVLPTPTPVYGMDDATIAVPNNQSVYYISGYTLYRIPNTTTIIKRMILVKVDAAGNVLWTRTNFINNNTYDEAGVSVETAPNGDVFIVGSARNTGNNRFHVSVGRVRSNGTLVWFNRYANSTNVAQSMNPKQSITTKDLIPNASGTIVNATGIAITGEYRNASVATSVNRAFTMRIYFNGTEVWRRAQALSGTQTSSGQDLIVDPVSNNLTVVGFNGNVTTNTARTIFWQLSGAGNQIASIVYNNPNQASHYAQSIVPALNTAIAGGGFAVAGSIRVSNVGTLAANRTYLLQLAANGTPNWMRYYQRTTPRFNATESVVSSLSGYYLSTNATKTATPDAHAIATDPAGMLPAASPTDCREIDASLTAQNLGDFTTIPLGRTPTTTISNVTLTAVTIDHPEDRCAPVTVVCPNCNDFSVTMGDCTSSQIGTTRQVSFGLLCTIPAGATGTMTWSFGDGDPNYTGPLASVIHNYAPGTYSVCAYGVIVLADGTQCPFDYCKTITVEDCDPCPNCSDFTYQIACIPSPTNPSVLVPQVTFNVNCTPSSTIAGGSVWWDFGDGSSASYPYGPVTHTYPATGGTYNVCHRVQQINLTNGDVCEIYDYILCQTIVVPPCPSPCPNCNDFSVSIGDCVYTAGTVAPTRQVGLGLLCTIPAGATGTMTWSFGDGSPNYTGALVSVIHNYAPGTYSVCAYGVIVLADGTQCPFDYCKTIVIPPCDVPCPTCNTINATVTCVQTPTSTTLVPQATLSLGCTFPAGSTGTVTWIWGDGSPSLTVTNLAPVTHIYAPGTYNVCVSVTVTLPTGQVCSYQFCRSLVVEPCVNPCPNCNDFSVSIGNCVYNGTAAPTRQVGLGLLCTIPVGATGTMTWSFGDGSPNYTGPLASVIHNYTAGTYSVCAYGVITLANGTQCPFDYCKTIVILPCDNLCPTCTDMTVTQGDCVTTAGSITRQVGFSMNCAIPTGATVNATWSWGDGSPNYTYSGPPISVIHNYAAGTYNVCTYGSITLSNGQICPFQICKTIVVEPCPSPCPNCNDFSVTIGDCVYTAGTASPTRQVGLGLLCAIPAGATGTMTWSFGDGSPNYTGPLASVIHNYTAGTYSVCAYGVITLANGTQCPFDYCKTIVILPCQNPCPDCNNFIVTQGDCTYNAATNTSIRQMGFSMNCAIPTGATITATWSWGDGTANYTYSGLPISVIHNYAAGTYNVCTWGSITLSNGQVCQFDYCKTITVEPCPNLCPTCTSFAVVQGECVATATGSFVRQMGFSMTCPIPAGATINATWAWGDGTANYTYSGLPMSVIHNYAPGTYNVCTYGTITLANGQQCFFEFCQQVVVEACQNPCPTCNTIIATVACVQVAGSTTLVPQATLSLGCTFPTGSTGTVTWIWGDGSASQTVANLSPVTHIYAPGTYNVCVSVTVTLPTGQVCSYQFCRSLTVTGCTSGCPTCQLSWQVACCTPPPPIPISNPINYTATFALGCNIPTSATITWQFGDGSPNQTGTSTITHSYGAAGTYNVCAIVQTPNLTCDYCTTITIASSLCASPIPTCNTNPGGKTTVTETWKFGVNVAPNPFANNTNIEYSLPEATAVTIEVYSITGQKVTTITNNEQHEAGTYIANFDASNLTAGTYYCTVQAGKYSVVKPLVLIK